MPNEDPDSMAKEVVSTEDSDVMLTSFDNPFNPFTQFDAWYKYDLILGHDCCGLLARTANTSNVQSQELQDQDVLRAIDEIVSNFPEIFKKVTRNDYQNRGETVDL